MELLNEFISSILQVIAFALIPFIVFLFRRDKQVGFLRYIGFYATPAKAIVYAIATSLLFILAAMLLFVVDPAIRESLMGPKTVAGKLREMGLSVNAVIVLIIIAWIKTSLSEEIFFRGFIGKRLISGLGFAKGNFLQAIIFGIVHLLLFWLLTGSSAFAVVFIFFFSTLAGWVVGFIKEKVGKGSIVPGWIAHGLGNNVSYYLMAFAL